MASVPLHSFKLLPASLGLSSIITMSSPVRPVNRKKLSSSVHLPDDIITLKILVNIACPKSVLRCTSVCKSWYSFINSSLFINLHLLNGAKHTKYLLCNYETKVPNQRLCLIQYDTEDFVEHYRLAFPNKINLFKIITIRGCCDGLICYTYGDDIYLWNPTIRRLRELPKYPEYKSSFWLNRHFSGYCLGFGFWFDKRENDYMVSVIYYSMCQSFVDIYSLSSNSWRIISHNIPGMRTAHGSFRSQQQQDLEHVAGTLHWTAKRSESFMIYSLDIKTGMFRETLLPLPYRAPGNKEMDVSLSALGEHSLAVFGSKEQDVDTWRCFIVLVYDENLNKLCTIDLEKDTCQVVRPMIGFRNNGEALFPKLDLYDWGIVSCNIETKDSEEFIWEIDCHVEFFRLDGHKFQRILRRVRPFTETLVLLNDRHAMKIATDFKED